MIGKTVSSKSDFSWECTTMTCKITYIIVFTAHALINSVEYGQWKGFYVLPNPYCNEWVNESIATNFTFRKKQKKRNHNDGVQHEKLSLPLTNANNNRILLLFLLCWSKCLVWHILLDSEALTRLRTNEFVI